MKSLKFIIKLEVNMKTFKQEIINVEIPAVILGCMRMAGKSVDEVKEIIKVSLDSGINFFDHADIYGKGESERLFGQAFKDLGLDRTKVWIQSKASIRPGMFDFSKDYLLSAVDGILARLQMDYLDSFLVHRPDTLVDLKEFAETLQILHDSGKVKYFGVSNCNSMQIEMLKRYCKVPLVFNQIQFGPMHASIINHGINVNIGDDLGINRDGSILEYSRIHDMTLQAWSPLMVGFFEDNFMDNPKFPELNECLNELADTYNVDPSAIVCAWITSHPANIQIICGSMTPSRIAALSKGADISLTRQEWYQVYLSAGHRLP